MYPAETSIRNNLLPGYGDFCVATENVCLQDFVRNLLLASVDDFSFGSCRSDLLNVSGFDRITQYDSHDYWFE